MAPQTNTDCGNFTLDFKHLGLCASPFFLQTLGPWFPNEMQNLLSSEKRTLDHWVTEQFIFSLAQVRHFWRCLLSSLTRGIRHLKLCGGSWCSNSRASVLWLWSSPTHLNGLFLTILSRLRSSLLLVHLFLPHKFLLMCLDAALWVHPTSFAITFWGFPSFWRVSMTVFCTTVRSAVFPMIVNSTDYKLRDQLKAREGTLCRCFGLISWLECDTLSLKY